MSKPLTILHVPLLALAMAALGFALHAAPAAAELSTNASGQPTLKIDIPPSEADPACISAEDDAARRLAIQQSNIILSTFPDSAEARRIYDGMCLDKMDKMFRDFMIMIDQLRTAGAGVVTGLITSVVTSLVNAMLDQIMNNLTNMICSVTSEITNTIDSAFRNLACFPSMSGTSPFNLNLDLDALSCSGFSVDLLNATGVQQGPMTHGSIYGITPRTYTPPALDMRGPGLCSRPGGGYGPCQ